MALPNWLREAVAHPVIRTTRAVIVFVCHFFALVAVLAVMKGVQVVSMLFFGSDKIMIFGQFPLTYVFQAIDLGLIVILGVNGLREAAEAYRRNVER